MKPLLLRTKKAKAFASVLGVVVVLGAAFGVVMAQQASLPEVHVDTATRDRITSSVVGVADIGAKARNVITLSPSVKVVDVLVQKGQRVSRGDVLVVLDTSEYASQLAQQGISLEDAEATLGYLAGPALRGSSATSQNAVSQARVALDNARAAQTAAEQNLAAVPDLAGTALEQAEIALQAARLDANAAQANLASVRSLNEGAVRQAEIALDAADDAYDEASRALDELEARLSAGQITRAEYDAQYPALAYDRENAKNARQGAEVGLATARVTAESNIALAVKAADGADLGVANAEATRDAVELRTESDVRAAQQAVSNAQSAVKSAEIALSNAQSAADSGSAGDRERISNQRSQISLVDANIRQLLDKIELGRLRAGVDGVVSRVDAEANQYPQLGDSVVVEGTSGYVANLDAGQSDAVRIRPGQSAVVTLQGVGTRFEGSVTAVAPIAEKSATAADQHPKVSVEVSVLNPDDTIRVGFEADVEILLDDKAAALQIDVDALQRDPTSGRPFVWVVDERNRLSKVLVQTGIESTDHVEVLSGLAEGQRCVVDPREGFADGTIVRIAQGRS